jgi:hypothetical protein
MLPGSFPAPSSSTSAPFGGPNLTNFGSNLPVVCADADGSGGNRAPSPRTSLDRQADAEAGPFATGQAPAVKPPLDEVHAPVIAVESATASCVRNHSGRCSSSRAVVRL